MELQPNHIIVFEHSSLWMHKGEQRLSDTQLMALQSFHGDNGVPYFSLIHQGVKFNEYVGVLQVGGLTIEVLPKADKNEDKGHWQNMLIGMLKAVGVFDIQTPTNSRLKLKTNSILDLYIELFLNEVEYLLHRGLVKKYRKTFSNTTALKGSLQFAQHIQKNVVHQERFYVRHTIYDIQHPLHQILYKALVLLKRINANVILQSKIGALLLNFPEQNEILVTDATFEKITFNRKTESYQKAIEIAKLLLLNYHPDVAKGRNHVLALMFDMNLLWEQFIYITLHKHFSKRTPEFTATAQTTKYFWKPLNGNRSSIRPDILIKKEGQNFAVLDTKWKNLNGYNPSPDDLRQLFIYHQYYEAEKVALVYPGEKPNNTSGRYLHHETGVLTDKECSVITLSVGKTIKEWQSSISNNLLEWIENRRKDLTS